MLPAQLFQSAADELCTAWNGQGSKIYKWEWLTSKSAFAETLGGGYLAMCNIPVSAASQLPDTLSVKAGTCHDTDGTSAKLVSSGGACSSECDDEDDVACLPAEHDRPVHFYDYHIVYLPSYSVPTLLFHGHHKDGIMLDWDLLVADLPESYRCIAHRPDARWTFISQIDHPHLKQPWYMLHPCQTAELLQLMLKPEVSNAEELTAEHSRQDYLIEYMKAWFSLVSPVMHMHLESDCAPWFCS